MSCTLCIAPIDAVNARKVTSSKVSEPVLHMLTHTHLKSIKHVLLDYAALRRVVKCFVYIHVKSVSMSRMHFARHQVAFILHTVSQSAH